MTILQNVLVFTLSSPCRHRLSASASSLGLSPRRHHREIGPLGLSPRRRQREIVFPLSSPCRHDPQVAGVYNQFNGVYIRFNTAADNMSFLNFYLEDAVPNFELLDEDLSVEEREQAEQLMDYQNKRGGKVMLQSIVMPFSEFDHVEKGDALHAMELALSLEKLNNEKLLNLHSPFGQVPGYEDQEDGDIKQFESKAIKRCIGHEYTKKLLKREELIFWDVKKQAIVANWIDVEDHNLG